MTSLSKFAVFSILVLLLIASHGLQSSASLILVPLYSPPLLNLGDIWHYRYSGPAHNSTEQILRRESCASATCVVDQETNSAWNDTVWLNQDWNLSREYYVNRTTPFNYSYAYTPAIQLYPFPLEAGKSWWWNTTVTGWNTDQFGNHTQTSQFSNLRKVVNETIVTVPAGTFDTFLVVEYTRSGTLLHEYRWFSTQVKTSVKWESFDQNTGVVSDSYVMTSYSLAVTNPTILGLNPSLFYSIVGAISAAVVAAVVVAFSRRKKRTGDIPSNPPPGMPQNTG